MPYTDVPKFQGAIGDVLMNDRFEIYMSLHRVTSRTSTRMRGHKRPRSAGYAKRRARRGMHVTHAHELGVVLHALHVSIQ